MTNLDGLCQGGPEGEKYPKTTRPGKATIISNDSWGYFCTRGDRFTRSDWSGRINL